MLTLDEVLARLERVTPSAGGYVARCPAHDDRNPSLSIREGDNCRVLLKCFAGCAYEAIINALGGRSKQQESGLKGARKPQHHDDRERIEFARRIWRKARNPRGTIVQDYLFRRGFTGETPWKQDMSSQVDSRDGYSVGLAIPVSIRFHPGLKHPAGAYLPAMVAAIETRDGEIVSVHRTFLKPNGTGKAAVEPNKMALGREGGCAVHLTAGAPTLVICEGIETGLSVLQATGHHVWAALGTSNLGNVELPAFVREVVIAADNDEPGMKAALAAGQSYRSRGYQVRMVSPRAEKADFNDIADGKWRSGRREGL